MIPHLAKGTRVVALGVLLPALALAQGDPVMHPAAGVYRDSTGAEWSMMDLADQAGGRELLALVSLGSGWARILATGSAGWTYGATWDRPAPASGVLSVSSRRDSLVQVLRDSSTDGVRRLERVPLVVQEVSFESRGLRLAGSIVAPDGSGRLPAIVMIAGSGPLSRRTPRYAGDWIAANGFVVLAYDKPGTGRSGGTLGLLGHDDWASDVRAALRQLARHPRVDTARIGLLAGSEGGFVAPRVARDESLVSFVLCRVCSATPHLGAILDMEEARIRNAGATNVEVRDALAWLRGRAEVALGTRPHAGQASDEGRSAGASWRRFFTAPQLQLPPATGGYWAAYRSLLDGDPVELYPNRPLAIHYLLGEDDERVRPSRQVPALERMRARLGAGVTWQVLSCADHGLMASCDGETQGFNPTAHRAMLDWLRRATSR